MPDNFKNISTAALLTLLLGLAFVVFQFRGWGTLVDQKVFFAGKYSNPAGSFMYVLTGLHLLHLVAGLIAITVVWVKSTQKKYNAQELLGMKLCAIFWHFLTVLWVYLFLFLLFIR